MSTLSKRFKDCFNSFQWATAMAWRLSSVCLSVNFLRKSLLLPYKWLKRHQTCTWWSPGELASRVCSSSRSRWNVTWYQHIISQKSLTQFSRNFSFLLCIRFRIPIPKWLWVCAVTSAIAHIVKVCQTVSYTVRSDVLSLRALRSLYEALLHSPSKLSIGQLDLMSKSWNELLRHWRSGYLTKIK